MDPIIVDDLLCRQVMIDEMTLDGDVLSVPPTLNPTATDRAAAICRQMSLAHYDGDGNDLGYAFVSVLARGQVVAYCAWHE